MRTRYSIIIPVYDRPDEMDELLSSLEKLSFRNFEVIIVEDGSQHTCEHVVNSYPDLSITYRVQQNQGPGVARNFGASLANGEWLVFLDSDTVIPSHYLNAINEFELLDQLDFFGGPDASLDNFTTLQKAIGYSMTSFLSTGGIRGGKRSLEKFKPRSFNMGIRRQTFSELGGFSNLRFGEDIDFSLRLANAKKAGSLILDAFVYHKRRSTFKQFFKQVYNSGIARVVLSDLHPGSLKIVHLLPLAFTTFHFFLFLLAVIDRRFAFLLTMYPLLFFATSLIENKSIKVAIASVFSVYVQLFGYGLGMVNGLWHKYVRRKEISYAFRDTFYED
ncbi:MAG: glycosyltransferase involved in cell wall biosynthesis [Cyclobacteriaceae bacterium]|jgi:glycosyltransferase involved in cell wall biosynthesis